MLIHLSVLAPAFLGLSRAQAPRLPGGYLVSTLEVLATSTVPLSCGLIEF